MNFYSALFELDEEEQHMFDILTEPTQDFRELLEGSAAKWREILRPKYRDRVLCKQNLIAESIAWALRQGIHVRGRSRLAAAFSLCVADYTDVLVQKLDEEEAYHGNIN